MTPWYCSRTYKVLLNKPLWYLVSFLHRRQFTTAELHDFMPYLPFFLPSFLSFVTRVVRVRLLHTVRTPMRQRHRRTPIEIHLNISKHVCLNVFLCVRHRGNQHMSQFVPVCYFVSLFLCTALYLGIAHTILCSPLYSVATSLASRLNDALPSNFFWAVHSSTVHGTFGIKYSSIVRRFLRHCRVKHENEHLYSTVQYWMASDLSQADELSQCNAWYAYVITFCIYHISNYYYVSTYDKHIHDISCTCLNTWVQCLLKVLKGFLFWITIKTSPNRMQSILKRSLKMY